MKYRLQYLLGLVENKYLSEILQTYEIPESRVKRIETAIALALKWNAANLNTDVIIFGAALRGEDTFLLAEKVVDTGAFSQHQANQIVDVVSICDTHPLSTESVFVAEACKVADACEWACKNYQGVRL